MHRIDYGIEEISRRHADDVRAAQDEHLLHPEPELIDGGAPVSRPVLASQLPQKADDCQPAARPEPAH